MASYGGPAEEDDDAPEVEYPDLATVVDWHDQWEEETREDRALSARDYDYYDNIQWTADEIDELNKRGQPVLTKNRIARKINFILGDEVEKGVDPVAKPKTPQHEDDATAATDALRATEETQDFDMVRSAVFKDALIAGVGGAHVGGDPDADAKTCAPLMHVPWDRLWWDPCSVQPDFNDGKYKGLTRWLDLEDAVAEWPDAEDALTQAVSKAIGDDSNGEDKPKMWADRRRKRVKIAEVYFRIGDDYHRACFTKGAWLTEPAPSPYLNERKTQHVCPLAMMSCYVGNKRNARYGVVRALISPQDEVNKRDSKQLHSISVTGAIAEDGAIPNPQEFLRELASPDGLAIVGAGRLSDNSVQLREGMQVGEANFRLAQQARADIDGIGPSSATLPDLPDSASGVAFARRQKAASKELAPVFASLGRWDLEVMRHDWMRICQYWTEEKWLRVSDDVELKGFRFVALNRQLTRAARLQELLEKGSPLPQALGTAAGEYAPLVMQQVQQQQQQMVIQAQMMGAPPPQGPQIEQQTLQMISMHPLMQQVVTLSQAAKMDVDIIIDTQPDTAILSEQQFEVWAQLVPSLMTSGLDPREVAKTTLELSSFRDKRKIIEALTKPNPQAAQMQAMAQQIQAQAAQIQLLQAQADVEKTKAQGAQAAATAQKTTIEAQLLAPQAAADAEHKRNAQQIEALSAGHARGMGG